MTLTSIRSDFRRRSRETSIRTLTSSATSRSHCSLLIVALMCLAGCGSSTSSPEALPPIAAAPVKNAQAGVAYIGSERCAACHREEQASYLHTAHSQALAEIKLDAEPPDGEFFDPTSQKHYRIYRQDGKLRHEESIRTSAGEPLILCDLPMRYVIGSGRFSRSYLVERDGFFFESPATWYSEPKEWKLSPGYEKTNLGFQRPVELRCLVCHAGRVEPIDGSPQHVRLPTLAIDCERCHGPGELHARKWEGTVAGKRTGTEKTDDTIFHPSKHDRQLGEDVCAQCHLHSAATVELRGRRLLDFRPGRKLSDYLTHYAPQGSNAQMKVVGHVEQMRLSRCYQADQRMSCLTCHDPHSERPPSEMKAIYRGKCLTCHTDQSCKAPVETRRAPQVQDDCIQCHMPRSPTDIPHFAFTHHRIGIHKPEPEAPSEATEELVLIPGSSNVNALEELRNRGLGYLQYSDAAPELSLVMPLRGKALDLLRQVQQKKLKDPEVDAALARLLWRKDPQQMIRHAKTIIAAKDSSPEAFTTACFTLGATYYEMDRPAEALPWLERAVTLQPTADVWVMLSDCRNFLGDRTAALDAARRACELAPDRPRYLQPLMDLLSATGSDAEAESLRSRFEELSKYRGRIDPQR